MTIFVIMLFLSVPTLACSIASFLQRGPVLPTLSAVLLLQKRIREKRGQEKIIISADRFLRSLALASFC